MQSVAKPRIDATLRQKRINGTQNVNCCGVTSITQHASLCGKTQFENTRTTRRNAKKKFQIRVHLSAGVSWAPRADIARGATGSEGKPNTCLDEHPSVLLLPAGADPQSTWLRTERIYNITEWDESPGEGANTPLGPPMFSMNPQSSGLFQWWAPLKKE